MSGTVAYTYNPGSRESEKGGEGGEGEEGRGRRGMGKGQEERKEEGGREGRESGRGRREQQQQEVGGPHNLVSTAFSPTENRLARTGTKEDHRLTGQTRGPRNKP